LGPSPIDQGSIHDATSMHALSWSQEMCKSPFYLIQVLLTFCMWAMCGSHSIHWDHIPAVHMQTILLIISKP